MYLEHICVCVLRYVVLDSFPDVSLKGRRRGVYTSLHTPSPTRRNESDTALQTLSDADHRAVSESLSEGYRL